MGCLGLARRSWVVDNSAAAVEVAVVGSSTLHFGFALPTDRLLDASNGPRAGELVTETIEVLMDGIVEFRETGCVVDIETLIRIC